MKWGQGLGHLGVAFQGFLGVLFSDFGELSTVGLSDVTRGQGQFYNAYKDLGCFSGQRRLVHRKLQTISSPVCRKDLVVG